MKKELRQCIAERNYWNRSMVVRVDRTWFDQKRSRRPPPCKAEEMLNQKKPHKSNKLTHGAIRALGWCWNMHGDFILLQAELWIDGEAQDRVIIYAAKERMFLVLKDSQFQWFEMVYKYLN